MRINHNITALNTYNKLTANTSNTAKSLEKLSSGLQINRAGDDAAGLAISEKMRGQISGLDTASSNANDGISLIKTAEGALSETHSILQRMRELAVQSANDTNTTADREEIQKEIDTLTSEVTRISTDTEFNTKKLLDGSAGIKTTMNSETVNATNADWITVVGGSGDTATGIIDVTGATEATAAAATIAVAGDTAATKNISINGHTISYTSTLATTANNGDAIAAAINAVTEEVGATAVSDGTGNVTITSTGSVGSADVLTYSGDAETFAAGVTTATTANGVDATITGTAGGVNVAGTYVATGDKITFATGNYKGLELKLNAKTMDTGNATDNLANFTITANNSLTLHIGANEGQNTTLSLNKMDAVSLGINTLDLTTQAGAEAAITTIDNAITTVSSERAKLGANQNRLEHTINNLSASSENLSAAESQIRDVDMAKQMTEFTKNNILSQAAQSMLAQANQQPQNVLQLLQ